MPKKTRIFIVFPHYEVIERFRQFVHEKTGNTINETSYTIDKFTFVKGN